MNDPAINRMSVSIFIDAEGNKWASVRMSCIKAGQLEETTYHLPCVADQHFTASDVQPSYVTLSALVPTARRDASGLRPTTKTAYAD